MTPPEIFFMAHPGRLQNWFYRGRSRKRAEQLGYEVRLNPREAPLYGDEWAELLIGVEALLTTWGSPTIGAEVLSRNDTLKIVGHVGGSVAQIVSPELYARGVKVCSANGLMARTVAEWSLTMTLVALRNLVRYARFGGRGEGPDWSLRETNVVPGDATIGIWGYGDVVRWLVRLLRPLEPKEILVSDEYLTAETAIAEGLRKVSLDELFARADVVHCLTGLTEANRGRIGAEQLAVLRDGAVLLNCGRAALVQEEALIGELRQMEITQERARRMTDPTLMRGR